MVKHGFTIVELVIVITIMGILLVLGVVNLNGSQTNSRDAERKSDVESIAIYLESYYNANSGRYPSTSEIDSKTEQISVLRDVNTKILFAPNIDTDSDITSLTTAATSTTPTLNTNQYIYQPLKSDDNINYIICTQIADNCRKFNLYYKTEIDNTVKMVTSKNQ